MASVQRLRPFRKPDGDGSKQDAQGNWYPEQPGYNNTQGGGDVTGEQEPTNLDEAPYVQIGRRDGGGNRYGRKGAFKCDSCRINKQQVSFFAIFWYLKDETNGW